MVSRPKIYCKLFEKIEKKRWIWLLRVEKYRPKTLEELISQEDIISTCKQALLIFCCHEKCWIFFSLKVQRFIKQDQLPHLLFYGSCHQNFYTRKFPYKFYEILKDLRAPERLQQFWLALSSCINRLNLMPWYSNWTHPTTAVSELCAIRSSVLQAPRQFSSMDLKCFFFSLQVPFFICYLTTITEKDSNWLS